MAYESESDDEDRRKYWSLAKAKRAYTDYLTSKREEIEEQQDARRYRHGAQWTSSQVEIFNKRRQPVVTYNRISRKVDGIIGLMEKIRQDPKAYPRNPNYTSEQGAELATAVVRYVVESQLRESRFPFAIEDGAVDGLGGIELVLVRGDKGDPDIGFERIKVDEFFYDPRSYDHDFADARYMGMAKWLDLDDAIAIVPHREKELEDSVQGGHELSTDSDRERRWFDYSPNRKLIRLVELWYKHQGGWCWCLFTGAKKLEEGKSYFFDEKGDPICKFIMFSSFIDHDGDRYGFVRNLKSSQDEINQRRSKGLHELVSRRIKAEDGAFADIELTRREAVRPDGVVIYNKGFEMEFDDQARIANVEGQLKFLEDAKVEIENFGPNPALIGQGLEYKSGRAINLLQQAGIAELGPFVINIKNWKLRLYRAIWSAVQRYWTDERWIRVTDNEDMAQIIQVNGVGVDPTTGLPTLVNAIGQIDVNFILEEGPDEVNMMGDAYDTLVALTAQGANIPPEVLLELAPLHGQLKRKLLSIVGKPDPAREEAKVVALDQERAKTEELRTRAAANAAKAQEAAQGGAHGIVERQMDAQMKEREYQLRGAETAQKMAASRDQTRAKLQESVVKVRADQVKASQDLQANALKAAQQRRQAEDQHRMKLREQLLNSGSRGMV